MRKLLPAHRSCRGHSDSDSSDSSDSSVEPQLTLEKYLEADMAFGLQHRVLRGAATSEMLEIFDRDLYSTAEKKAQQALFDDLMVAAQLQDSRPVVQQQLTSLLSAAKRVLPQKLRQQLTKAEKQAAVAASRAARRGALGVAGTPTAHGTDSDDNEDDCLVMFSDVPLEVVAVILKSLDPISLASSACVCRAWHELAARDECWIHHLQSAFPATSSKWRQQEQPFQRASSTHDSGGVQQQQPPAPASGEGLPCHDAVPVRTGVQQMFASKAARSPAALLPWKSCRMLLPRSQTVQWCLPAASPPLAPAAAGPRTAGSEPASFRQPSGGIGGTGKNAIHAKLLRQQQAGAPVRGGPLPLTSKQVVSWMLGQTIHRISKRTDDSDNSDDSDNDSSSSSSCVACDKGHGDAAHSAQSSSVAQACAALKLWNIGGPR